jgi:hypothetical protein
MGRVIEVTKHAVETCGNGHAPVAALFCVITKRESMLIEKQVLLGLRIGSW